MSDGRLTERDGGAFRLETFLHRSQRVTITRGLLDPGNHLLRDSLGARRALVVTSPSVWSLYGRSLHDYLSSGPVRAEVEYLVLDRAEASKSLDAAVEVCERASAAGLRRTSPIVAVGGGVCSDICGLAAALHHRGVPHLKVPTTLVGMIDAGIGSKNAVNHGGRKSALGTFHPPEHSLLDPGFLASLPRHHLANGLAEIVKLAIVSDAALFELVAGEVGSLLDSNFSAPAAVISRIIRLSVTGMLRELAANPFETADYRRQVDFGHTFSPHVEVQSGHSVLHGEAVAIDMALSSQLARELGLLAGADLERILSLLEAAGLPTTWPPLSADALWASLAGVVEHRNGDLHLVVPTRIGRCEYLGLERVSPTLLRLCHERLSQRSRATRAAGSRAGVVA